MANMSYCRFQNTLTDLEDCLEELANNGLDNLSEDEKKAAQMHQDSIRKVWLILIKK